MKIKVKFGIWGNYKGYEGAKQVFISKSKFDATDWLAERLAKDDCELSTKSDIQTSEINEHIASLAA